ncbi:MAG: ADP-forming succinate--CoA ligase subunit beta [Dehalococcoidia bacterium]|nr:MAG: ADP-forming succinate--CoA ligase subunit beta [Dehalococcoidia bacterium]
MKVHEYQAKQLLAQYGVPVPRGSVAKTAAEAKKIAADIGGKVVVKAQVHAGGRGKAGGIKVVSSPEEAEKAAGEMIGSMLVTHQTSAEGALVNAVLVEEAIDVERELYLGIVIDGVIGMPVVMASEAGGMDIEEVARTSPDKIFKTYIDPGVGVHAFRARGISFDLNLEQAQRRAATETITNLYKLFEAKDCSLAEINPLVITTDGRVLAADAKLNFDDNAAFRQKDIEELRDTAQEDPLEVEAKGKGIENYIKLDGNIGCLVNGAGLAMAVLDLLKLAGGNAANFLDIGTINDVERVIQAIEIINSDPDVKAIFINIFGGMARTDVIAQGIVEAHQRMEIKSPVVVRLAGTNVDEGDRILKESGLNLIRAYSFKEAAEKAVAAA